MIHMDFEQDDDTGDAEYQAWKKITKKGRAKVAVSVAYYVVDVVGKGLWFSDSVAESTT